MPASNPSFRSRLRAGEQLLGPLLRMPNETLVELTGLVGMDFVVIDTEHGPADQIPLTQHLVAAAAAGVPALVRVGQLSEVLRVLDAGAAGIIVPHISSVEQAQAAVRAASYPPQGDRGFATYSRSGRQGLAGTAEHLARAAADTVVVLMIEDAAGVAAAEEIAAVAGVDALFVGPADLAVALGMPGEQSGAQVQQVIAQVHDAARRAGAAVISIAGDAAAARRQFAAGSTAVIYNALAALGALFTDLAGGRDPGVTSAPQRAPLVVLPGMLSTPAVWDAVIAQLDPSVRVSGIRIDRDNDITGMAESVLAQAPQRFCLAGHSLGGIVALEVARQAPERVQALILANCSGRAAAEHQLAAWAELRDRTEAGQFETVLTEQASIMLGPAASDEAMTAQWLRDAHRVGPDGLLRELGAQITRPDSLPLLPAIAAPVLVLGGELDDVCPPALQEELAGAIPGAVLHLLPAAGHLSMVDSPTAVAESINAFLLAPG